jgi:hypothetical protein
LPNNNLIAGIYFTLKYDRIVSNTILAFFQFKLMWYYKGVRVTRAQFIRLKELEKEIGALETTRG